MMCIFLPIIIRLGVWLIVLKETEKLDAEKADLAHNKLIKIKILLIASIRTLKSKK